MRRKEIYIVHSRHLFQCRKCSVALQEMYESIIEDYTELLSTAKKKADKEMYQSIIEDYKELLDII